jgi:F420-dependent oxidoreductase-like protein
MPFAKPLARTREYIGILRDIWARNGPVTSDGPHYSLPLPDGTGLGKPLKASIHPLREEIPIYLGAEGPKNIALCAELCDGWLAMLFSPSVYDELYKPSIEEGFARRDPARRSSAEFEVCATVPLIVTDDLDAAADALRPFYALYFGGMGAKGANFHANVPIRMGYEREVGEIQELYLAGKKDEAGAKIPRALIEELSLIGPAEKIREDLHKWRESVVSTLLVSGDANTIRAAAELVLG